MRFVKLQIAARDAKTKVSIFSLLFAFRWYFAQNAIIPVPSILKRSEYEFLKKSCVRGGNCNLVVQDAKVKASIYSVLFAFLWFLVQNWVSTNICSLIGSKICPDLENCYKICDYLEKKKESLLSKAIFFSRCL